jgi:uncharacterized surface protein with fasciclin (FAS1) repeats
MKNTKLISGILFMSILLFGCTNEKWDEHYQADPELVSDKNLWMSLEAIPELSIFTGILKNYGYDRMLSQSQAYTVFAPCNDALAAYDSTGRNVKTELIDNHIARFIFPASGNNPVSIGTLNTKKIELAHPGGNYFFGSAALSQRSSITASNGVIHVLDAYEAFFPNTWEYLARRSDLDSIKNYLYSFDEIIFYPDGSVPGSVVDGQMTYLDSVFIHSNLLLHRLGYINVEDSSYTMLAPTNAAWIEAYDRIRNDFVYYNQKTSLADSLQRAHTSFALIQDLIFSNTMQVSPQDSLISTSKNTFYRPQYLFDGCEQITTSNGSIYISNQLKYKPYESWHSPIQVEAERALGRENTLSTAYTVRPNGTVPVSEGRYLQLIPTTSSGNPTVTFEIPNTLSSAYNVYCVFVTAKVNNPNAIGLKPCKVYFNLNYLNTSGDLMTDRFPESGTIETNPNAMDTVLVASNFKFPVANYGEEEATVTLKVFSNVARSETTAFSRDLLLDCILLKPEKQ